MPKQQYSGDVSLEDVTSNVKPPQLDHELTKPFLTTLLTITCLLSLFSNSLIIHVVRVNHNKRMRTTINYFIANMALGDFLVAIFFSAHIIKYLYTGLEWNDGPLEQFFCQFFYYIEIVSILCSVFSLVAITFDRFMAIVYPFKYKCQSSWVKFILPSIWVSSLALPAHLTFANITINEIDGLNDNKTYAIALNAELEASIMASFGYFVPHIAMVIMYVIIAYKLWTRRIPGAHEQNTGHRLSAEQVTAKKVTLMIICILFVFNVCWFPSLFLICFVHFMHIHYKYHSIAGLLVSSLLAISNGPLNAITYTIFCRNFRDGFKSALKLSSH